MNMSDQSAGLDGGCETMAAAVDWVGRLRTGLTESEREAFVAWLQTSPAHVRAYLSINSAVEALRRSYLRQTAWVEDYLKNLE